MTKLLDEAFRRARELPERLQDELAQEVLDGLVWEEQWEQSLRESADALDTMAGKALDDLRAGRTGPKGMDELGPRM